MPYTLLVISFIMVMSFLFSWLFRRGKLPPVVGQVMLGLVIGTTTLKEFLLDPDTLSAINILSDLGIIFLLYLAGLEIDLERMKKVPETQPL